MTYEPIWSGIIATYLFLAGLGGGAFIASAFLKWKHPQAKKSIRAGRLIAPIVVIIGVVLLMFDAKAGFQNPMRFALLFSNVGSVMTWGVVFLTLFIVVTIIVAIIDLAKRNVPKWLDVVGVILSLCVAIYTGCLLGVCKAFPLWNNPMLPILFMVSAVSSGMAAVLLVSDLISKEEFNGSEKLKKFHFWLPVIELLLVASLL
ncbi:MAG: polysulfide reductase NrfD, partial [Eggerthellaceae bacterium]|nr:polysulfide reductase NrfD [Eggerthellaceae bacterium]